MTRANSTRRRAAILHADIQGYSRLMADDEVGAAKAVSQSIDHMTQLVADYAGQVVQISGDAVLALFEDPSQALRLAIRLQTDMAQQVVWNAGNLQIAFRIGIDLGCVLAGSSGHQGHHINVATRIQELAPPGGICVSQTFEEATRHVSEGLELRSIGRPRLKNIGDSIEVFSVQYEHQHVLMNNPSEQLKTRRWFNNRASMVTVLPFDGLLHDTDYDQFCDDLSGNIAMSLARFRELSVVAHQSAVMIKHFGMPNKQIQQHLGARYITCGGLQCDGTQVRLRVELLETESSSILWSDRFDCSATNGHSFQDHLANLIASRLAVEIDLAERHRLSGLDAAELTAHGLVLRGSNLKIAESRDANLNARQLYEQAIQIDPAYACSYAAMSETYLHEWRQNWSKNPDQAIDTALSIALEATERDPRDASGFAAAGQAYLYMKNFKAALDSYRNAIEMNPNDGAVLIGAADALSVSGHLNESNNMLNRAIAVNPYVRDLYYWNLGSNYYQARDYDSAIRYFERMAPNPERYRLLAATYIEVGSDDKARSNAVKLIQHYPEFSLEHWSSVLPHPSSKHKQRFIDALQKAGIR